MNARISYLELPEKQYAQAKQFYKNAFGWEWTDYGPTYASTMSLGVNVGLQGDTAAAPLAPLVVLEVTDLETALADVTGAGGAITQPIFSFPGGRRFQFRDPSGNELAVMQPD
jgi:predicted enzyme related to lactoylglutathione lyase